MAEKKVFNAILRLRRDNDFNYKKYNMKPASGELCLVDTATGLQAKIGNGTSLYNDLPFANFGIVNVGFYSKEEDKFYKDSSKTQEMDKNGAVYIDAPTNRIYYVKNDSFVEIYIGADVNIPLPDSGEAGLVKLYSGLGSNEDGAMTQKAVTEEFNKIVMTVGSDEDDDETTDSETLILSYYQN